MPLGEWLLSRLKKSGDPKAELSLHDQRILMAERVADILSRDRTIKNSLGQVILFGSVAQKTDGAESDIDMVATSVGAYTHDQRDAFQARVIEILRDEGIPLGDPEARTKKENANLVTLFTAPQAVVDHPERHFEPFQWGLIALFEKIRDQGIKLYS